MSFAELQSGWLHKLSWVNIHRSWRKRHFVLGDKELRYYKHQGDIRPTGIVDLKHYRDVTPCSTKQSQWSFRIDSGCRHHFSHILHADSEADREIWVQAIRIKIHKQHNQHSCSHSYYDDSEDTLTTAINNNNTNDSVLDKWLERLDLQEDNGMNSSNKNKSSSSSINSSTCRPISTSLPHHYSYNNSAATIGCFDFPPESVSPTTASPSSTVTPSPSSLGESNHNSRTSMLANAFAINARTRLRRRVTTNSSSSSSLEQQQQQQPSSPRTSNETTGHPDSEWSALELFHFEEDAASTNSRPPSISSSSAAAAAASQQQQGKYNTNPDTFRHINGSMELSVIPPCLPPPTSPLPPPPKTTTTTTTVHRRLSEHTHPTTTLL